MNKKTDISKNLNNEQENHARSLLKNLLKLGENPESLKDIFSLEINKSIQENLSLYNFLKSYSHNKLFDHAVEISTEDEKKQLNEIFKNQDPKNPLSIFHEAPKDSTYLEKQHKVVANILRRHLSSNYTMLNEFSGLREQIYKFYKDSPIILFKKCKSIAHYKLLTEKMNFPTEQANKEKDTLVNLKLIALYNFLNLSREEIPHLMTGGNSIKFDYSSEKKEIHYKNKDEQILNWVKETILIPDIKNKQLLNSTVSMLLNHDYSAKRLKESYFPEINWNMETQTHIRNKDGWNEVGAYKGNHFINITISKKLTLLNKKYILQPEDWKHIYKIKKNFSLYTETQKNKLDSIISSSVNSINIDYKTPEGDIADSLIPLNIQQSDNINKLHNPYSVPFGRDTEYIENAIDIIQSAYIDIFEIREDTTTKEKYSIFTNAFLGQRMPPTIVLKKSLALQELLTEAPESNIKIIEDFFIKKTKDFVFDAISMLSKTGTGFAYQVPTLEFIANNKNISLKVAPYFMEAIYESELIKTLKQNNSVIEFNNVLERMTTINNYLIHKNAIDGIKLPQKDNEESNSFKL